MTSSPTGPVQNGGNNNNITESTTVTTLQRIYRNNDNDNEDIVIRDPVNRRSFINRSAYAKLHRSLSSSGTKRHSVDNLRGRFEIANQSQEKKISDSQPNEPNEEQISSKKEEEEKFTPASFGYPKTAKLLPPLIKPKPTLRKKVLDNKDENCNNVVGKNSESSDADEIPIVIRPSASEESIDKISKELSSFTMDGKPKERKRAGSFRKLFMGGLFGKDKKKKEDDKNRSKYGDNIVYNDNLRNETNFSQKPIQPVSNHYTENKQKVQEVHEEKVKELEQKYAALHVNRFNEIRQTFNDDYLPMETAKKQKPTISDYISTPVSKYIDTSSTASTESEKFKARDTPPRAQETNQNFKMVKPERGEKTSPRTIERNLNKSNSKDYPDKPNFQNDTYGTVFDSLEYAASRNGEIKPINSPKSPSLEGTKLRLPPNREIYDVQPRVKSPIPMNRVSTEKIIATELLKSSTRSPTPPKRTVSKPPDQEYLMKKPPISPKPLLIPNQPDKIVTNAMVHAPRQTQTPLIDARATTPVDQLRMSVALKLSPQKEDIRKSVEEYYWKELKKLKEEEDSKLFSMPYGYYDDQIRVRRSRSLSPSSHKSGRRSFSLPRDVRGPTYVDYGRIPPQQSIPEERPLVINGQLTNRQLVYNQNFVRNNPERRSVDSLQRPIFRRGSLTQQEFYETQPYNKKVSFSNSQMPQQVWPTRNGFTQSPPQRRIDNELDDEVFLPEPVYGTRYNIQNEPVYSNRVLEQFRAQQVYDNMRRQQQQQQQQQQVVYGQQLGPRRLSMDSIPRQDIYVTRNQMMRRVPQTQPQREMIDVYNNVRRPQSFQQYPSNSQLSLQYNPMYSSRQSITDANYGQTKQVTVRNKVCDMYGQIHDSSQTGIVMGRLHNSRMAYPPQAQENFVRGSRLTASANDIGKRYNNDPRYDYDRRPLPPTPASRKPQISDTESGSDASEIQRIMQTKTKNKKRGFFGK